MQHLQGTLSFPRYSANQLHTMASIAPKLRLATQSSNPTVARIAATTTRLMGIRCASAVGQGSISANQPYGYQPTLRTSQSARAFHNTRRQNQTDSIENSPKALLPEFDLKGKVIVVSGGARGLGLVQAEALLEAGATGIQTPLRQDHSSIPFTESYCDDKNLS